MHHLTGTARTRAVDAFECACPGTMRRLAAHR